MTTTTDIAAEVDAEYVARKAWIARAQTAAANRCEDPDTYIETLIALNNEGASVRFLAKAVGRTHATLNEQIARAKAGAPARRYHKSH